MRTVPSPKPSLTPSRKAGGSTSAVPYLMLAPAVLLFVVFVGYPILSTLVSSLYRFGLSNVRTFVGLSNFRDLLGDPVFWISLRNNVIILVGSVVVQVGGGLILAALLNRGLLRRWTTLARTIVFAPMVMSSVAVGLLWQFVYNPAFGLLNAALGVLNVPPPPLGWLGDPNLAIYAILFAACWQYTGFMMVLLLAGMQSVPAELYEAATLDGASEVQSFRFITVPAIRGVIVTAVLITMIGSFKAFDSVYVLTLGGPANASEVLATYLYKNAFNLNQMGYASAIAVVLLAFTLALSLLQLRLNDQAARPARSER